MTSLFRVIFAKPQRLSGRLSSCLDLTKWKLSMWVSATGAGGYLMATPTLSPEFFYACGGIFLCSSAAHAFNQIIERKTDALMIRTRNRVLPSGIITPAKAAAFGTLFVASGSSLLYLTGSTTAAPLALMNVALYTCGYTFLKRYTEWNTHVGAIVGAVPPLIGYAAAGGSLLSPEPWMLFGMIYMWQLPHFYSLAWLYRKDYLNAGLKMYGTKDDSGRTTALTSVKWMTVLTSMPLLYSYAGWISPNFAIVSLLPNLFINHKCLRYLDDPCKENATRFFVHSLWHVLVLVGLASYYVATDCKASVQENNIDR
ncbi:Protoheme IX farnesyltransferase [Babesia sp. Xinjiang]|uniref:Protoheme IX farnesyltransferase n=1 Tax=Babesia sp. Xinjiang TaxID=462227 RepID=UPI000A243083|nr:Protoheme IX farnesyltransferase [Babesia sp. Xinjiang]ORM40658.1 Protoheme IX farnesyltransferase [Babesia sp. Xinjiang]